MPRAPRSGLARSSALVLGALGASVGCSLLTDLDGLSGPGTTLPDAASPADEGGVSPGDVREGGSPSEGGAAPPDGSVAESGAPLTCAAAGDGGVLCDDFERDALEATPWGFVVRPSAGQGTLAIEPRAAAGAGRALRVSLPALPVGYAGQDEPHLRRDFDQRATRLVVAFDLAYRGTAPLRGRQLLLVRINADGSGNGDGGRAFFSFEGGRLLFCQQAATSGAVSQQVVDGAPVPDVFHRYEMLFDFGAKAAAVRVDGVPKAAVALDPAFRPSTFSVSAGFRFGNLPTDPVDVSLDDVVVFAQ